MMTQARGHSSRRHGDGGRQPVGSGGDVWVRAIGLGT
jgi:hypothetical protein